MVGCIIFFLYMTWLIRYIKISHFHPKENKRDQLEQINKILKPSGFVYNWKGDYFCSRLDCWQRDMGYCKLYDEAAPFFNMIIDCEPITFSYGGKRWLIELWKGQYGIATGAEIGIYNTKRDDICTEKFEGTLYEKIADDEMLSMSFVLRKNGKVLIRSQGVHWWLSGFKLGEYSMPGFLTMDIRIIFPDLEMVHAFVGGVRELGYGKKEYLVRGRSISLHFENPYSEQTAFRNNALETRVQRENSDNVRLYKSATEKISDTLDKIQFLKSEMPELFNIFLRSLYEKGLFEGFDWQTINANTTGGEDL